MDKFPIWRLERRSGNREREGRGGEVSYVREVAAVLPIIPLLSWVLFPCNVRVKSAPDWEKISHSVFFIREKGTCWYPYGFYHSIYLENPGSS